MKLLFMNVTYLRSNIISLFLYTSFNNLIFVTLTQVFLSSNIFDFDFNIETGIPTNFIKYYVFRDTENSITQVKQLREIIFETAIFSYG